MENFKVISREKNTKCMKYWRKLIEKGVFLKPKQRDSGNGNFQRWEMNKYDRKAIFREVVTAIG